MIRIMVPMHHKTLVQGFDPSLKYPTDQLLERARHAGLSDRVLLLAVGEQVSAP